MKLLRYNHGGITLTGNYRGCGTYRDTRHIGHGIGATIQLAAGFCWNKNRVRWLWGLHRGDCRPISPVLTQVDMTCRIQGGGHRPIMVSYVAHLTAVWLPFITRTETLDLIVTPQGYRLQLPSQSS